MARLALEEPATTGLANKLALPRRDLPAHGDSPKMPALPQQPPQTKLGLGKGRSMPY